MASLSPGLRCWTVEVTLSKNDAWILVAIGGRGEYTTLRHVITSADYLNRLLPTSDEIEEAINHLGRVGLVVVSAKGFALTPSGVKVLDDLGAAKKGVIRLMLDLMKAWEGISVEDVAPGFTYRIDPTAYDAAVEGYPRGGMA